MARMKWLATALVLGLVLSSGLSLKAQDDDPYENYIKTSKDFKRVKMDRVAAEQAMPGWTIMPWTWKWPIGFDETSGKWCLEHGINGVFVDRGDASRLPWINQFKLRFYMDHTAGKGDLHMWDGDKAKPYRSQIIGTGVRVVPVNSAMLEKLKGVIGKNINAVKDSPYRGAYALDDEISWDHFINPSMWCVTDDKAAYPKWLEEIYGKGKAPHRSDWIGYNDILPKLSKWDIASFDASQLMDQWTFNDAYFNNFVGDLVEYANSIDPAIPCGFVGGQLPDAFGGFDYVRTMRKIQYVESYGAQPYVRSFSPDAVRATCLFYKNTPDTVWQSWFHVANGNRAMICWVNQKWWDDAGKSQPWLDQVAPTWKELTGKIAPLLTGTDFIHDGVALYYNHASIQLGWIMDAQAHGKSWPERKSSDPTLSCSAQVRNAWMNMCWDEGLQFNWLGYADLVEKGVPPEYKVLILPHVLCLSDVEATKIKEFCVNGGTVIADYMPGLWDQHGKGRPAGGALDEMFGVKHDSKMKADDVFGGALWAETDQEANFKYKSYQDLLTNKNTCIKDASGFNKAVRKMEVNKVNPFGKGRAVLMNLSPQWYNSYRVQGVEAAAKREVFMKHIKAAGLKPWVRIKNADGKEFGYETIYWRQGGRTLVFLVYSPEVLETAEGGGNAWTLKTETIPITLEFAGTIKNVKDERSGKDLGEGNEFKLNWTMNEAVVLSFEGAPPR